MLSHHRYLHRCHPIHARSGQKLSERSEGSLSLGKEAARYFAEFTLSAMHGLSMTMLCLASLCGFLVKVNDLR